MKRTVVTVTPQELSKTCAVAMKDRSRFITMIATDEKELGLDRFVVRYLFQTAGKPELTVIEAVVPDGNTTYASVASVLPAAAWAEREAYDLFGLLPSGHPDLRPLVLHEHWPDHVHPLRKEYSLSAKQARDTTHAWTHPIVEGDGVFAVPVGPVHAGVIEPGHFRFQVMGDSILHLEAKLFYKHRGIEKRAETMSIQNGLLLAERICGVCSLSHALSYAQAIESLADVEVPTRAAYLRVLYAELERLYNHVGDIGNMCAGIGYAYGIARGARLKECLMRLNDRASGHRFLRGTIALGGVAADLSDEALQHITVTLREVRVELQELVERILSQDIVINRFAKTGILAQHIVRDFSAVGPTARASNYDVDVRRDLPYAAYKRLSFTVPTAVDGDVLARFKLRVSEAEQSFYIIEQVIRQLPEGATCTPIEDVPKGAYGIGITESPRGENVHFVMTGPNNLLYRYRVRSAPFANWPVVPYCVPGNIVPDFPLINKSFELCYACCDR